MTHLVTLHQRQNGQRVLLTHDHPCRLYEGEVHLRDVRLLGLFVWDMPIEASVRPRGPRTAPTVYARSWVVSVNGFSRDSRPHVAEPVLAEWVVELGHDD